MKKLISLILIALLLVSGLFILTGCGDKENTPTENKVAQNNEEEKEVIDDSVVSSELFKVKKFGPTESGFEIILKEQGKYINATLKKDGAYTQCRICAYKDETAKNSSEKIYKETRADNYTVSEETINGINATKYLAKKATGGGYQETYILFFQKDGTWYDFNIDIEEDLNKEEVYPVISELINNLSAK